MTPSAGNRKLAAVRSHQSQRHLQTDTPASRALIVEAPEHFHRAAPRADMRTLETTLEDLLPALRQAARHGRSRQEALR